MPSTPANGPSPTAATNSSANTNESMPRRPLRNQRTGWYNLGNGVRLRQPSSAIGKASNTATVVPMAALAPVSAVRNKNNGSSSTFGGQACASQ